MKNTIIFILGCFAALLFGALIGEKFGVFGITNRSTARDSRATYSTYYHNFYNGLRDGFRAGIRSEKEEEEGDEDNKDKV